MAITNNKEFEVWLGGQDQPANVITIARIALRIFPLVTTMVTTDKTPQEPSLLLLAGRAILTSLVVCTRPTNDVKKAVAVLASSVVADAARADHSATSAVAARSAYSAVVVASAYANMDITENNPSTIDSYHDEGMSKVIEIEWNNFQAFAEDSSPWAFWREWYQSFLDAKPMNWDLQKEIALIPNEDWDKGVEHIAEVIAEIKARFVTVNIPLSEEINQNPKTGKFYSISVPARKPDLLKTTLEKVSDALNDALSNSNGLRKNGREVRVLRKLVNDYAHNPERIEMDFVDVYTGLVRQIDNKELPASEEILSLSAVLKNGALDIRANHPDIAANRETRAARALQELSQEQKQTLASVQPIFEAVTEGKIHQDAIEDIPALINDMIDPISNHAPPVGPAIRLINRASKISLLMRQKNFDTKLVEKCGYKSMEILSFLTLIIGVLSNIFGLF